MEIESGYQCQHYHCASHGADVLRTLHVLCSRGGIWDTVRSPDIGVLGMYLAAIVHDYEHVGGSISHTMAIQYVHTVHPHCLSMDSRLLSSMPDIAANKCVNMYGYSDFQASTTIF